MPEPFVLVALADEPSAPGVQTLLQRRRPPLRIGYARDEEEVLRRAVDRPALIVLSQDVLNDDYEGFLRSLAQIRSLRHCVVLFHDPADPRRAHLANLGVQDYVVPPGAEVDPKSFLALLENALSHDSLEEQLAATRRQVHTIIDRSNDGVYILRGGHFAYVNARFAEMVGFAVDDLLSNRFSLESIVALDSRDILRERQRRIQQGLPLEPRYEFLAQRRDKSTFDAMVSVSYIEIDGAPATLGIMQDITERKRFERELVRRNHELALLHELTASINRTVNINDTLDVACRRLRELLSFAAVAVTLIEETGTQLELKFADGLPPMLVDAMGTGAADPHSLLAHVVRTGEVELVHSLRDDPRLVVDQLRSAPFGGGVFVPLEANGRTIGVVCFFTHEGHPPRERDAGFLRSIGSLLGTAIEKAALLDAERAAVRRLETVDDIALAVSSSLDVGKVATELIHHLTQAFAASRVLIARYDPGQGQFVTLPSHGSGPQEEPLVFGTRECLMGMALQSPVPVQLFSTGTHRTAGQSPPYDEKLFREGFGSTAALRIVAGDAIIGAIHLTRLAPTPLSAEDLVMLQCVAPHVAVAIQNAELFTARAQALSALQGAQEKLLHAERMNALGELAAGVAHDFNNVLGAILGRAQLLKDGLVGTAFLKHAVIIEKAALDGAETVRRIREIGRADTTADFVPVDVGEILRDVVDFTTPRWRDLPMREGREIVLRLDLAEQEPFVVEGNPHELREVLVNLVHNAVDAMPTGGSLTLSARFNDDDTAGQCEICIRDTGTGIPEHVVSRIFDPFFTTKGNQGTGLGLSVSYRIIQRHRGEFEVVSSPEGMSHGTTFTIRLPCTKREMDGGPTLEAPASEVPSSPLPSGRARILVIDDEENIREILRDILETAEHEVVTAENGTEGLASLDRGGFDLVITDLSLPGMTGYEVASLVKRRASNVMVALVTGWGANLDEVQARTHGVDLMLGKPFRFEQVLLLVEDALRLKQRASGGLPSHARS
ncbi:MAG: ATP-binding protein [Myxococcota bacterium]